MVGNMFQTDVWAGAEAGMDLDGILLCAVAVLVGFGTLFVLLLYAEEHDEETGDRSLTVSDLKRFGSLSILEKIFAVLVVSLIAGIIAGIVATIVVAAR